MICPFCSSSELKVVDKRDTTDLSIRRRRECDSCKMRFTTFERIVEFEFVVIKRNGVREKYSKEKLKRGIILSCKKRPVTLEQIDNIILDIEQDIKVKGLSEIESVDLGRAIMDRIKDIDDVAYVRFASIFENFDTVKDFKNKLKTI